MCSEIFQCVCGEGKRGHDGEQGVAKAGLSSDILVGLQDLPDDHQT